MTGAFIVDSSVAMTRQFKDEQTAQTRELLQRSRDEAALVPSFWYLKLTNVLALAERKGRITPADSAGFIADLSTLSIDVDDQGPRHSFTHILPLCRLYGLTSYDAMYLELAIRRRLPLATLDEPLRAAAAKAGVKLLGK
jgi:predicted nucleic acid-binding protein